MNWNPERGDNLQDDSTIDLTLPHTVGDGPTPVSGFKSEATCRKMDLLVCRALLLPSALDILTFTEVDDPREIPPSRTSSLRVKPCDISVSTRLDGSTVSRITRLDEIGP